MARTSWLALAFAVHAAFLTAAVVLASHQPSGRPTRDDARYPGRQLASAIRSDWRDDTSCPLSIVVGPTFEAGIVSVYNGGTAMVLEDGDFSKSPWITPLDVKRRGAVYVSTNRGDLPSAGVTRIGWLDVSAASPPPRTRVYWAIAPPLSCNPASVP